MVTTNFKPIFLLLLLLPVFSLVGQSKANKVLGSEQARFDAMKARDTVALHRFLSDDLVYIHSNALRENKSDHIRSIVSGKIVYQSMDREGTTVRIFGETAITSGEIHVKGIISGNPFDVKMLYTAVYRKKKQRWQLVSWQTTRIP